MSAESDVDRAIRLILAHSGHPPVRYAMPPAYVRRTIEWAGDPCPVRRRTGVRVAYELLRNAVRRRI